MPFGWGEPSTPTPNPDDLPAASTTTAPPLTARILSQAEQDAIIKSLGTGYGGWTVVGGQAAPDSRLSTGLGGRPENVSTGTYGITISDGQGHNEQITIYPGATDASGTTTWIPTKTPADLPKPQHPDISSQNGQPAMTWDPAQGKYVPLPGAPVQGQQPPKQGDKRAAVEGGRNVEQTYDGGQWVTTTVKESAIPGAAVEGSTQDIVESGRYVHQEYHDGKWVTTKVGDSAIPGAPKVGDKRPSVESGRNVEQTFDGTTWRTTSVGESAIPGAPTKGTTRNVVENGRNVTQTFDGTTWTTTALGDLATPGAAKVGDTRPSVENGRNVTQTFDGTVWRTTGLGDTATPGAAKEGDTRKNVQGGYTVSEVYKNGQWIVDPSVPPVQFTPDKPTVVSAPNTQANIATMANGQISTQANPNYTPISTAEIAGQVSRLQAQAQAQRDQLLAKQQSGAITADQANTQFNQWWAQNVEPQKAMLDAAQKTAVQAEQQKAQEQARLNLGTAQAAGNAVVTATAGEHRVGPGFGAMVSNIQNSFASGKPPAAMSAQDWSNALVTPSPDYSSIYENATAQALKHISPTAAQIATGQPVPTGLATAQGMNVNQVLNQTQYGFPGGPSPASGPPLVAQTNVMPNPALAAANQTNPNGFNPQGSTAALNAQGFPDTPEGRAAAAAAASATVAPTAGMSPADYAALQQRIQADQAEQARQAQVNLSNYAPANYQPAF
jgi:hypothetical protein